MVRLSKHRIGGRTSESRELKFLVTSDPSYSEGWFVFVIALTAAGVAFVAARSAIGSHRARSSRYSLRALSSCYASRNLSASWLR